MSDKKYMLDKKKIKEFKGLDPKDQTDDIYDLYYRNSLLPKTYKDTNIYRSLNVFMTEYLKVFTKIQKDIKFTIGYKIVNKSTEAISYLRKSLETQQITKKLDYSLECRELLEDIKIYIKLLEDQNIACLSDKQYIHLCELLGKTQYQLKLWIDSLKRKNNDTSE